MGILTHPRMPETGPLAEELVAQFAALGVAAEVASRADAAWLRARLDSLDLLITLGGDGTIVRAARAAAGHDLPVLGVNLGQLGFLAELRPSELAGRLEALARGEYRVEERTLLRATVTTGDGWQATFDGLNDVVVARAEKCV